MMFLPLDILVLMSSPVGIQNVYLSGISTDVIHHLGLGSLLRPVLNLALLTILTGEIVLEFWAKLLEHHKNGKAIASFFIVDEVIS